MHEARQGRGKRLESLCRFCLSGAEARQGRLIAIADGRERALEPDEIKSAAQAGLLERRESAWFTSGAGRTFIRRMAAARATPESGDAFQDQHRTMITAASPDGDAVRVNLAESPLAAMARLKRRDGGRFIEEDALMAGERLRSDFTRGQLQPRISANWEAGVSNGGPRAQNGIADLADTALAARQRTNRALETVGPELSGVLLDVCCFLKGLETVERERGWPARSAKLMLRTALAALSRHYGYRS